MYEREKWAVDYRNWIGASRHGMLFIRARKGTGRWRKAAELPDYVREFLTLKPLRTRKGYWVISRIRQESQFRANAVHAKRAIAVGRRIYCQIQAPPKVRSLKSYAPVTVARYLRDYDSPWQLYRAFYKYTDCGPSLGLQVEGQSPLYCDSLPGSWRTVPGRITGFVVGSIVEGVDFDCENIEVPVAPLATLKARLDDAVDAVNLEASQIWNATHGCPKCGPENELGYRPINPKCKACKGEGAIL